eukprot:TRINITY_DN7624_c0_g1_i1.p1 TRINITY_DN7624_c0_g1~~TRINITY_DN7624_c0_g1_i1.p1  ORF type:complete len:524 (-),score=114.73 TRINITY_DN7624_c0_g1_i1:111-1682(-)
MCIRDSVKSPPTEEKKRPSLHVHVEVKPKQTSEVVVIPSITTTHHEASHSTNVVIVQSAPPPPPPNHKERTYIMVKPDGVQRGAIGTIIEKFENCGFKLIGMKMLTPTRELLEKHYEVHFGRPFYEKLLKYVGSGPVVAMVWEGLGAVAFGRKLLGKTQPLESDPRSVRGEMAMISGRNLIHGSDSVENGLLESSIWFREDELAQWDKSALNWVYSNYQSDLVQSLEYQSEQRKQANETKEEKEEGEEKDEEEFPLDSKDQEAEEKTPNEDELGTIEEKSDRNDNQQNVETLDQNIEENPETVRQHEDKEPPSKTEDKEESRDNQPRQHFMISIEDAKDISGNEKLKVVKINKTVNEGNTYLVVLLSGIQIKPIDPKSPIKTLFLTFGDIYTLLKQSRERNLNIVDLICGLIKVETAQRNNPRGNAPSRKQLAINLETDFEQDNSDVVPDEDDLSRGFLQDVEFSVQDEEGVEYPLKICYPTIEAFEPSTKRKEITPLDLELMKVAMSRKFNIEFSVVLQVGL